MTEWIGVDLDGTLAYYDGWQGVEHIGEPILAMVNQVKQLLDDGADVRIFTARVHDGQSKEEQEKAKQHVIDWCKDVFGRELPVTCQKDNDMRECYDDRATQVIKNTGVTVGDVLNALLPYLPKGLYEGILDSLRAAKLAQRPKGIREICSVKKESS